MALVVDVVLLRRSTNGGVATVADVSTAASASSFPLIIAADALTSSQSVT